MDLVLAVGLAVIGLSVIYCMFQVHGPSAGSRPGFDRAECNILYVSGTWT